MLWWIAQNMLVTAALAAMVALICRVGRLRPAVQHALWAVVLLKFVTPALVSWPWPLAVSGDINLAILTATQDAGIASTPFHADTTLGVEPPPPLPDQTPIPDDLLLTPSTPIADFLAALSPSEPQPSVATINNDGQVSTFAVQNALHDLDWSTIVLILWLTGALGSAYIHVRRILCARRRLQLSYAAPVWLVQRVRFLAKAIGVSPPPALVAPDGLSPHLWCLGRPKLVWPEALTDPTRADAWTGVIAHELAHLRRRDHWLAWLELVAGCLWWFNPIFWLVRKRLRESAELACDAWAVWAVPGGQRVYAQTLVEVTQLVSRAATPAPALGASTGARRSLERRLTMILSQRRPCKLSLVGALGAALLAVVALPAWSLDQSTPPGESTALADGESPPVASQPPAEEPEAPAAADPTAPPAAAPKPNKPVAPSSDADRIAKLEEQIDALLKEVRHLRDARSRRTIGLSPSPLRSVAPDGKIVAVMSGVGQVTLIDAATGKQLAQTDIGREKTIRSIAFSPDGKQIAVQSDGSEVITLDAATGKINRVTQGKIHTRKIRPADADTDAAPRRERTATRRTFNELPAVTVEAAPTSPVPAGPSISSAQLDLVRLATEYSDAVGSLKLAQRMLEVTRAARGAGDSTPKDVVTAEVQVNNAAKKVELLREIAKAAAEAAQYEFSVVQKRPENRSEAVQAEAKLRILKLILGSQ